MADVRQRTRAQAPSASASPAPLSPSQPVTKASAGTRSIVIPASIVPVLHTFLGYTAFLVALGVCYRTHWHQVLKNEVAGWPQEWFPSVSAVTGDWYPARNIFQIIIAMAAGPRFMLIGLNHVVTDVHLTSAARVVRRFALAFGLIRALSCGGWVYITSTDQHMIHDVTMITYLVAGLLYMLTITWLSWRASTFGKQTGWEWRASCIAGFLSLIPFLVYWFIQHKVKRIPGAYSIYALFEWSVIVFDVGFDYATSIDVRDISVQLVLPVTFSDRALKAKHELESVTVPKLPAVIGSTFRSTLPSHLADTYLGFVFWSMTTSLGLTIWYFPLWNMGISGFEAFLFTSLSPILLGISPLRRIVFRNSAMLHLFSLVGLLAYYVQEPVLRLSMVGTGVGLSFMAWFSDMVDVDGIASEKVQPRAWKRVLPFLLGLMLSNIAKVYSFSNNPVWPTMRPENGGLNELGAAFGVIACLQVFFRTVAEQRSVVRTVDPKQKMVDELGVTVMRRNGQWTAAAVGFGSLMFALHSMLTDSGIICLWATDGYPNPGPDPLLGGVAVLFCMGLGLLASRNQSFALSYAWWMAGTAGIMALYFLPQLSTSGRFAGFAGGLVFAIYAMSIAPALIQQLSYFPIGRTMFVGLLTYSIMQLAHVWVVAYAFVPGGPLARERTHYVIGFMQFLLFLGTVSARSMLGAAEKREAPVDAHKARKHEYGRATSTLAILYVILAAIVGARMSLRAEVVPYHPEEKIATMGIWTVHFGLDNEMYSSHQRMANVIRELELDVVGLLESDTYRIIMGNRDITQYLSETLGMYSDYGPGPTKHTWGCSMLSKFPIVRSTHHLLPSPVGELACAIHATLDIYGKEVDVIVSHNGQEEDWLDRQLQTQTLAKIMDESPNPFVFLGYVVTSPGFHNELYRTLSKKGRMNDVDSSDWDRWCQYIFYRGLDRIAYARVSHGGITDTEIQTAKFAIPEPGKEGRELQRTWDYAVPEGRRYPNLFLGAGVRNHQYHVFNEPKYWD
ncbi:hypothetical protein PhCBS80983_g01778 [Powellomyces hirtus]|uniref:Calcofluor white hypersensitive protein n=1 Tax=Powellomyces hirtus TaxID=109895 RepID=A0A507E9E7_9FUNG|nr:hypothetical protein PhCBS80983_g01778 [Powellomyces hirtus]